MSDWPASPVVPAVVSTFSREGVPGVGLPFASVAWSTANKAIYFPLRLSKPFPVRLLWWANGAAVSGNVDVGVFGADLSTKIVSTGAVAQAGVSTVQSAAPSPAPFWLPPGQYYLGLSASSTTATFQMPSATIAQLIQLGVGEQLTAHPLPATATAVRVSAVKLPLCGLASVSTI